MSRRRPTRSETVRPAPAYVREELGSLAVLSARADLSWLARHQRDVAARESGSGRALTGMPAHRSTEPRLPGALNLPDLSGDIARQLDTLVHELLDVGVEFDAQTEAGRWLQAAQVVDKVCDTEMDALAWWDTASGLRARAERALGPAAAGRFLGRCSAPGCDGDIRIADDQAAAVCPGCGGFVTRAQQVAYVVEALDGRVMTLSGLATALAAVDAEVPFRTLQTWARRRQITEHIEWQVWRGFPYTAPTGSGLYPFMEAFTRAAKRATRVRLEGSAA